MKLQGSGVSSREILQSQIGQNSKNRLALNRLAVVHGRLLTRARGSDLTGIGIALTRFRKPLLPARSSGVIVSKNFRTFIESNNPTILGLLDTSIAWPRVQVVQTTPLVSSAVAEQAAANMEATAVTSTDSLLRS
jgi:hypothetical protein